jgi:hypothetical protein
MVTPDPGIVTLMPLYAEFSTLKKTMLEEKKRMKLKGNEHKPNKKQVNIKP